MKKRFRRKSLINFKNIVIMVMLFLFISVGFSNLVSDLKTIGTVNISKKKWDATEVSYYVNGDPNINTVHDALEDLYKRVQ